MMFGLMVIQQQLRRIEGRLARLEARMSAVEQRVADLDEPTPVSSGVHEQGRHGDPVLDGRENAVRSG